MIGRATDRVLVVVEGLLCLALAAMVVMVFGNVVLRYAFDSGITVSEELSRYLFVWITFLGALAVMRQGGHLGFDLIARALPRAGRQACRIVSDLLTLLCCVVFLRGAWSQTLLNMTNMAPVSGVPLGWVYASAVVCGAGMVVLTIADLVSALRNEDPPEPPSDLAEPGA